MAEYQDREHFIPLRKATWSICCCTTSGCRSQEREPFRQFCRLVSATFHFEYLAKLEELKDAYAPFDPDADTRRPRRSTPRSVQRREDQVFAASAGCMERANFKQLQREEIEQALRAEAERLGHALDVDFNRVFERLDVYVRGDVAREQTRRSWRTLWRREKYAVPTYQRLALILKLRPSRRLDPNLDVNRVYFKVFKDMPKADIDMLLPGGRPHMTRLDRALVFYPLLLGLGLLVYHLFTQVLAPRLVEVSTSPTLASVTSLSLAAGFCGYAYKSVPRLPRQTAGVRPAAGAAASTSRRWTATPAC